MFTHKVAPEIRESLVKDYESRVRFRKDEEIKNKTELKQSENKLMDAALYELVKEAIEKKQRLEEFKTDVRSYLTSVDKIKMDHHNLSKKDQEKITLEQMDLEKKEREERLKQTEVFFLSEKLFSLF